jgi:hypothetical protein
MSDAGGYIGASLPSPASRCYDGFVALPDGMWRDIVRYIREHPEAEEELRALVLSKEMLAVPTRLMEITAALDRLTNTTQRLAESDRELRASLDRLERAQDRLSIEVAELRATVSELAEAVRQLVVRTEDMNARLDRHDGRMGNIEGGILEERYSRNLSAWLADVVRRATLLPFGELDNVYDGRAAGTLSEDEYEAIRAVDIIARGKVDGTDVLVAGEISTTINVEDIARADSRAGLLRKVGYDAVAFAGGYRVTDEARTLAERLGVHIDLRRPAD